jgi:hypothetical protein
VVQHDQLLRDDGLANTNTSSDVAGYIFSISALKRAQASADVSSMSKVPFRSVARGLRKSDVSEMLRQQMEVARDDPAQALELLAGISFADSAPGVDRDEVMAWVEAQQDWLNGRIQGSSIQGSSVIGKAVDALSSTLDELKRAIESEAGRAERRADAAAADAERRCAALVAAAERTLAQKLSQSSQKAREDADHIRRQALADAEKMLERAGAHAASVLLQAHDQERKASAAVEQARLMQAELLESIDAAQATVRRRPKAA